MWSSVTWNVTASEEAPLSSEANMIMLQSEEKALISDYASALGSSTLSSCEEPPWMETKPFT